MVFGHYHAYADVDDSYTKSLLHFNGTDASTTFTDESGKTWTANGDAQIDTAQSKFGGASGLFDGNGDYVSTGSSSDFSFGGDFTIDCWVKYNGRQSTDSQPSWYNGIITDAKYNSGTINGWRLRKEYVSNTVQNADFAAWTTGTSNVSLQGTSDIANGSWHHIAVVRNGSRIDLYVDGVSEANTTYSGTIANDSTGVQIGKGWTDLSQDWHNGWIDEVRISKGIARWTSNFTPPTAEYAPAPTPTPTPSADVAAGWNSAGETWTYASSTTITVPSDATTKYSPGDKIRLKQGGSYKYFYIIGVTSTVLTVTGGSDYSVANSTITDNDYSKVETPVGFPQWFNWTPTYSGSGSLTFTSVGTHIARFSITGRTVHVLLEAQGTTGGTAGAEIWATTPVTSANSDWQPDGGAEIWQGTFWQTGRVRAQGGYLKFVQAAETSFNTGYSDTIGTSYTYEF